MERILSQTLADLGSETPLQLFFDIDALNPAQFSFLFSSQLLGTTSRTREVVVKP